MLQFTFPIRLRFYFYAQWVGILRTFRGMLAALVILGLSAFYLWLYAIDGLWVWCAGGIAIPLVVFGLVPCLRYRKAVKIAGDRTIIYRFDDKEVVIEVGAYKSAFKAEAVKQIKMGKAYLRLRFNNGGGNLFFFFKAEDRDRIVQWLQSSVYKGVLA